MKIHVNKSRMWAFGIALSLAAHILFLLPLNLIGGYHFVAPVKPIKAILVDLQKPGAKSLPIKASGDKATSGTDGLVEEVKEEFPPISPPAYSEVDIAAAAPSQLNADHELTVSSEDGEKKADALTENDEAANGSTTAVSQQEPPGVAVTPPLRTAGEFITTKRERLSYLINLHGIPVGSAELEAKNENGEVRLTLKTRSNAAFANIFPVDDIVETRHLRGNFILTKIRQQEGTLKRNIGFTIFLRDKNVFWIDLLKMRSTMETVPTSDVLDTLSAFYYLRNRLLHIGKTEMLHIYDGNAYADVPVEVLRQENVLLPNLKNVDTLVLRLVHQTDMIFQKGRDTLIWLTNDEHKVPVKVETNISIGRVSAVLISTEI
jgi:hypothetical protein